MIKTENAWLMFGDCLGRMKEIPTGSVDMVLTDPPYGTTECQWDSAIPLDPLWEQLKRVIKPNGVIALFGTEPFSSAMRMSNFEQYKYDWLWAKNDATNAMHAKNRPMRKIEKVMIFSAGKIAHSGAKNRMPYNPQGLRPCSEKRCGTNYGTTGGSFKRPRPSHTAYVQQFTGYPSDLIAFAKDRERLHPTQKPIALMEYLIKTYTNEGDTVLDFTMGSGTTGVACAKTGRKFIGIELDPNYYGTACERILTTPEAPTL